MIDTSVLCEMLQVPGKSNPARGAEVRAEIDRRWRDGERFVIPITAVIETGNHIAQADGNRYDVAGPPRPVPAGRDLRRRATGGSWRPVSARTS